MSERITPDPSLAALSKTRLAELRKKIRATDETIVAGVARRMSLSIQVLEAKMLVEEHPRIVLRDVEADRLKEVAETATELGVNIAVAQAIETIIIGESVKVQTEKLYDGVHQAPSREQLLENLLALTARVAPNYADEAKNHGKSCPASSSLRTFEGSLIARTIEEAGGLRHMLLDIGCADGGELRRHVDMFAAGFGVDISPAMVEVAKTKSRKDRRCAFACANVEERIPLESGEACFAVVSNGTGSDFFDLPKVLGEISRVLRRGGHFHVSFHNAEALASAHGWLPWVSALRATPSRERGTQTVRLGNGEAFEIPGRAYSLDEIEDAMPRGLQVTSSKTYSHMLSMLPAAVFTTNPAMHAAAEAFDFNLAAQGIGGGAYLMVSGVKS